MNAEPEGHFAFGDHHLDACLFPRPQALQDGEPGKGLAISIFESESVTKKTNAWR
jgi:hypothetical protein